MNMIVSKDSIPKKWDVVTSVKYSKDRSVAQIEFNTGSKILIKVDPSEFQMSRGVSKPPVVQKRQVQEKVQIRRPMSQAEKDADYKNRAMNALQELGGSDGTSPRIDPQTSRQQVLSEIKVPDGDAVRRALAESESISERIGKELEPKLTMAPK